VAAKLRTAGADCFVVGGITANGAVQLYKDVLAAVPDIKMYGPDGVAETGFMDPEEGGIPPNVQRKVKLSVATLDPSEYPPDGRRFFRDYEKEYGESNPNPYAVYGYEAMDLVLDTCERIGPDCGDRQKLIDALFETKGRESVLGTCDRVRDGELGFDETIKASQ
jgi:branched-chain amino acid transport system substrate-binding protein